MYERFHAINVGFHAELDTPSPLPGPSIDEQLLVFVDGRNGYLGGRQKRADQANAAAEQYPEHG